MSATLVNAPITRTVSKTIYNELRLQDFRVVAATG